MCVDVSNKDFTAGNAAILTASCWAAYHGAIALRPLEVELGAGKPLCYIGVKTRF